MAAGLVLSAAFPAVPPGPAGDESTYAEGVRRELEPSGRPYPRRLFLDARAQPHTELIEVRPSP